MLPPIFKKSVKYLKIWINKKIDYEDLSYQIKSAYKKLNKTKFEIFKGLSEKIHKVTLQEEFFCDAITCYFIQSCEVFDAISK